MILIMKRYKTPLKPIYNKKPFDFWINVISTVLNEDTKAYDEFKHFIDFTDYATLVELDDSIIPLITETKNKIFYRPLFVNHLYINNKFTIYVPSNYDDLFIQYVVHGIGVIDTGSDLILLLIYTDPELHAVVKQTASLFKYNKLDFKDPYFMYINELQEELVKVIRTYICNIIDFVDNQDDCIQINHIVPTKERQQKRKNRNKNPIPTRIVIKPKKQFIEYTKQFNKDHNNKTTSHRFLVRGHWRHFKADRYSELKKQTPVWIKPYYKGEGIVINKSYLLKDK